MKKILNKIKLFSCLSSSFLFLPFVISCSSNKDENYKLNDMKVKEKLDSFLESKQVIQSINIDLYSSINEKSINLFNVLRDFNSVDDYFQISNLKQINDLLNEFNASEETPNRFSISFSFDYSVIDSYGKLMKPYISVNKKTITIPILIWFFDEQENIQISKYVNCFNLNIEDGIVNNDNELNNTEKNNPFIGSKGKFIKYKEYEFQVVPNIIIDKYLDFVEMISSDDYIKPPIYSFKSDELKEWKSKTLSEVRTITNAILPPTNFYYKETKYSYSIVNSYFAGNDRRDANFIISISISNDIFSYTSEASSLYNLNFVKEYSIFVDFWKFATPSKNDISNYVSNNQNILNNFYNEYISENILLFTPIISINKSTLDEYENKIEEIVRRFDEGYKIIKPPTQLIYETSNGQSKIIYFEISSIETTNSNDIFKINIDACIDNGDLKSTKSYSKFFNINSWKFVENY